MIRQETKQPGKEKYEVTTKQARTVATGAQRAQRVPLGPARVGTNGIVVSSTTDSVKAAVEAIEARSNHIQRPPVSRPPIQKALPLPEDDDDLMEIEDDFPEQDDSERPEVVLNEQHERVQIQADQVDELWSESEDEDEDDNVMADDTQKGTRHWPEVGPETSKRYQRVVDAVRENFEDDVDLQDMTMVSEYSEEIFAYMSQLEVCLISLSSLNASAQNFICV